MEKDLRQQQIMSIIQAQSIGNQTELARSLEQAGFPATQSSISRDLDELRIVKRGGRYVLPRTGENGSRRGLLQIQPAGESLLVLRCEPGMASAIAVEIDRARMHKIVGTLAGEDTVFIAVAERRVQGEVMNRIWEIFA